VVLHLDISDVCHDVLEEKGEGFKNHFYVRVIPS